MNKIIFAILALIISSNIIPSTLLGIIGAIIFWDGGAEHYFLLFVFLALFINLVFKISVLPIIFEIQKKYKMKALAFWENLANNKKYRITMLVISAILDFIVLILNINIFEKFGIITYILIGGGFLLSYCSLLAWLKLSKSKYSSCILNIFKTFVLIGLLIFLFIGVAIFNSLKDRDIKVSKYHEMLKEIKADTKNGDFSFFPQEIPANATNYYFQLEDSFDGYNTHYVRFDIDKEYIDNVLKNSKCEILTTKDKISNYNVNIYPSELQNADKICILHKSTQDDRYTSGISVYNDTNTIYFFFANF